MKSDEKNQPLSEAWVRDEAHVRGSETTSKSLVCPNCGGSVSAEDTSCPYCGALNPAGAEKAYMDALEDLKDDTDKLAENAQEDIEDNLKSNTKWIITLILVIVAFIAVAVVSSKCVDSSDERHELQGFQERESFREQYFSEFDRLYEVGDDEALSKYVWSLMNEPGFDALISWKHYRYLEIHDDWEALNAFEAEFEKGQVGIDDYAWAASVAMRLACLDADGKQYASELTDEEEGRAAEYRNSGWRFLQDTLQMTADEVEAFAVSVEDSQGNIEINKMKEGLKQRFEQLGSTS